MHLLVHVIRARPVDSSPDHLLAHRSPVEAAAQRSCLNSERAHLAGGVEPSRAQRSRQHHRGATSLAEDRLVRALPDTQPSSRPAPWGTLSKPGTTTTCGNATLHDPYVETNSHPMLTSPYRDDHDLEHAGSLALIARYAMRDLCATRLWSF